MPAIPPPPPCMQPECQPNVRIYFISTGYLNSDTNAICAEVIQAHGWHDMQPINENNKHTFYCDLYIDWQK